MGTVLVKGTGIDSKPHLSGLQVQTHQLNEVSLTFHAEDAQGHPVNNLKLDDLIIYDNYKPPRKLLVFRSLPDIPIHAGLILNTSESMQEPISHARRVAIEYVQRLLRPRVDRAFSEDFGYVSRITQTWTGDRTALAAGIGEATMGIDNPPGRHSTL